MCHINMLKPYVVRASSNKAERVCTAGESVPVVLVTTQTYCPEADGLARGDAVLYGDIMIDELRCVSVDSCDE